MVLSEQQEKNIIRRARESLEWLRSEMRGIFQAASSFAYIIDQQINSQTVSSLFAAMQAFESSIVALNAQAMKKRSEGASERDIKLIENHARTDQNLLQNAQAIFETLSNIYSKLRDARNFISREAEEERSIRSTFRQIEGSVMRAVAGANAKAEDLKTETADALKNIEKAEKLYSASIVFFRQFRNSIIEMESDFRSEMDFYRSYVNDSEYSFVLSNKARREKMYSDLIKARRVFLNTEATFLDSIQEIKSYLLEAERLLNTAENELSAETANSF